MIEQLENEKVCRKCGEVKPLSAFPTRRDRPCGVKPECRACTAVYQRNREDRIRRGIGPSVLASLPFQPDATLHRTWQQIDRVIRANPAQNLSWGIG